MYTPEGTCLEGRKNNAALVSAVHYQGKVQIFQILHKLHFVMCLFFKD